MQIQQQNQQKQYWLQCLSKFRLFVSENTQFLTLYNSRLLKRIGMAQYPIENCLLGWQKLNEITNKRIQTYLQNPGKQIILSNALFWVIPLWATSYTDIHLFIERYCQGLQGEQISYNTFEEVCQQLKLRQKWNLNKDNIDEVLYIPFYILEQLVMKGMQLTSCLEQRLRRYHTQNETNFSSELQDYPLIEIQSRMLQTSLSQLNSIVQINKQKSLIDKDHAVIKFDYITQQYDFISNSNKKFILKYIKRIKLISRWKNIQKKRVSRLKQRKMNIFQLINGEENYLNGLKQYITNIKDPIQQLNILSLNQLRILFSSIIQITTLHENIYSMLKEEYNNYDDKQCYAPILKKIIPFFKVYTDYVRNAQSAQKFIKELIKNNNKISQICKKYTLKTNKLAQNQLLQPTFRIARYEALFQEIVKKTSSNHKDYHLFIQVQVAFKKVLREVNNEVDRIIRSMRLQQLDKQFGTVNFPIFQNNRQYLNEFSLTLIKEPYPQQVILIIFNDLLLIIDEFTRKLQKSITINQEFFARREEDNKIYRNMVTIHSDGFITFTVGTDDIYANKAKQLYQILKGITKESGQLVYISVLGTEQIGSTSFAKYTEYIVEVKYLDIKKILHLRFSIIFQMISRMQIYYQNSLKINQQQESLRKNWFNSHKTKTIQARKLIIGQIFQKLFNHQTIKKKPHYFLTYLNLPENFYDIARSSYEKRISVTQTVTLSKLKRAYLSKKQQREAFTILCGTEIKLGRDLFHDFENTQYLKRVKSNSSKIQISVITLDGQQPTSMTITQYDTVENVCNRISKQRGLSSNRDFRLFHQIGKKQLRVLEHQQLITKIFQFPQRRQNNMHGYFEKFKSTIKNLVFPQTFPILIFKKYYYLPYQIEQVQMRKDLVRLKLLVYQTFAEIKEGKYQLNFDQYLLFLSMLTYTITDGNIRKMEQLDSRIVHKIIPDNLFKLKNYTEDEWLEKSSRHFKRLHEEIIKIIQFNKKQYEEGKIKIDTSSKERQQRQRLLYFGHKQLCSQIVLNKIRTNSVFGCNLFYVQPHNNCYKKLQQKKLKVAYNMWLAVSIESIKLLSPSSKQQIFQLKYEDIDKTEVFCEAIVFKTNSLIEQDYRFNTYQSFQISQLVKYNKALNEVLVDLKNDGELSIRVKSYRQQLIQYRSTFQDAQSIDFVPEFR